MKTGEKIRNIRKQKGLTQAELTRDSITRNMLSQIETGKSTPSLQTLIHIAKILEVPVEFLISEDDELFNFLRADLLKKLKSAFNAKRYADCLFIWEKNSSPIDDEIAFILAYSALECGSINLSNGNLITASEFFKKSLEFTEKTIYPTNDIRAKISIYSAIANNVQSPKLEFEEETYIKEADKAVYSDLYNYVTENHSHRYSNEIMKKHLKAKELMKSFHYLEAADIMTEIEANRARVPVDSYILFGIYSDLEHCAKELSNYEDAYKYSSKRLALLSAFKA